MAIDLSTPGPLPAFKASAAGGVGTTCTEVRVPPFSRVTLFGDVALYVFNGVADGAAAPASTARKALTATQAAAGYPLQVGGAVAGGEYATVCVATQSGTGTVEVVVEPSEIRS